MALEEPVIDRLPSLALDVPGKLTAKTDFAVCELILAGAGPLAVVGWCPCFK
jgi:hypothetical protein